MSDVSIGAMSDSWHPPMTVQKPLSDNVSASMQEPDRKDQNLNPIEGLGSHSYVVLATLCTVSLIVIAWSLVPISRQATRWNGCFQESFRWDRRTFPTDPQLVSKLWATRYCNGGSLSMPRE